MTWEKLNVLAEISETGTKNLGRLAKSLESWWQGKKLLVLPRSQNQLVSRNLDSGDGGTGG